MIDWVRDFDVADWTLIVGVAVLAVASYGLVIAILERRRGKEAAARPEFQIDLAPAPGSGANPNLQIICTDGTLQYDLVAEILTDDSGSSAAIALISAELAATAPGPGVHKRYTLGRISKGEMRSHSVQPDPGIGGRMDDRAILRLIATAAGASWESIHTFRMLGYGR